jgi:hypothetical protein
MEGTQRLTKRPCSLEPENHRYTDSKKAMPAANRILNLLIVHHLFIFSSYHVDFVVPGPVPAARRYIQLRL